MTRKSLWKIAFATAAFFGFSDSWAAVVIEVNGTADEIDDDVTDGICHTASGACSLRAAVMTANREALDTIIALPPGVYVLTLPMPPGDDETGGDLNLISLPSTAGVEITIQGQDASTTIIDGGQNDRVLEVMQDRYAVLSDITIRGGVASEGGGIRNSGVTNLVRVIVRGNKATAAGGGIYNTNLLSIKNSTLDKNQSANGGGGIYSSGVLDVEDTLLTANSAGGTGGAILNAAGYSLFIQDSTVDSNTSAFGGGIANVGSATIQTSTLSNNVAQYGGGIAAIAGILMINSTIAGNNALLDGGGIYAEEQNAQASNIYNSTIAYNGADSDGNQDGLGGGIYVERLDSSSSSLNLYNSLVAGNTVQASPEPDDCHGTGVVYTHARNLFGTTSGCPIVQVSGSYGIVNSLGYLGPLQYNGGPTKTVALLKGSSAIDGGYSGGCFDENSNLIVIDQRGFARPVGPACDVGSFEFSDVIFKDGFE